MERRYRPQGIRAFGDQVEALCREKGMKKQELAEKVGITPSQLAHYLKFGASLNAIERVATAAGVSPSYFDVYVTESSPLIIQKHPELLDFMRALNTASESKQRALLKKFAA